jgi:hypothetical protein
LERASLSSRGGGCEEYSSSWRMCSEETTLIDDHTFACESRGAQGKA